MLWYGMTYEEYIERDGQMLIDNLLFDQEWYADLPLRHRYLYIYLLTKCTKVGVFEVNLRKFTYDMNDGLPVTNVDIFQTFGNRIQPLGETKGIVVDYLRYNWCRDKPLDPNKNPLHKGLLNELRKYGLDFRKLNEMATKKFKFVEDETNDNLPSDSDSDCGQHKQQLTNGNAELFKEMFDEFWKEYPSSCPRKVDKKKCGDKYLRLLRDAGEKYAEFHAKTIAGLRLWKQSEMWQSNGGAYIKAPLVWLNNENWNDNPMKGNGNSYAKCGTSVKRADNFLFGTVEEADQF